MTTRNVEVLLVEDDPDDVELTLHTLEKHHLANRIHVVRDGAEALDFLFCRGAYTSRDLNHAPRVVLLDLKLPKVDGLEVLRQIRGDERTRMLPVVIMTSSREEHDVIETYKLGINSVHRETRGLRGIHRGRLPGGLLLVAAEPAADAMSGKARTRSALCRG